MTPFEKALYSGNSIPDVLDLYSDYLRSESGNRNILHATKLSEYKNIISIKSYALLRITFDNFYNVLCKEMSDLRFRIAGRRKSLISVEQKIQRNLDLNKSLDLIRDMLGVRIILLNGQIDDCYTVLEKLISCCIENGFTICEETSHNSNKDSLHVKSPTLSHFYYGITDYIANPKQNGYRSLHATFRNSSGFCFEVQVRTFDMHCTAVYGDANHQHYKSDKYNNLNIDRSKINIPGYYWFPDDSPAITVAGVNRVIDLAGVEFSVEILQRNKSF